MQLRAAKTTDAQAICELVNHYAEQGKMLHRSLESVYDSLRDFLVAEEDDGRAVGCVAVDIFWSDLAEVKSLAVAPDRARSGVGSALVRAAMDSARSLGIKRLFALTYEKTFFEHFGFAVIDRDTLPEKVWRECIVCPKLEACDEIAMLVRLNSTPPGRTDTRGRRRE
jgi:amino-acid N-acetyltransferase